MSKFSISTKNNRQVKWFVLLTSYSPSGRLGHNSCGASSVNKRLTYGYDEDFLTHQPRVIFDTVTSLSYNLYWDANGNLESYGIIGTGQMIRRIKEPVP